MSSDGMEAQAYILSPSTGVGGLLGGRVWELEVPPAVKIPRIRDVPQPYATVHFGMPVAAPTGRGFVDEIQQPHVMAFQIHVHASAVGDLRGACAAIWRKVMTLTPSTTNDASAIRSLGGIPVPRRDDAGAPSRFTRALFFEVTVGLSGSSSEPPPSAVTPTITLQPANQAPSSAGPVTLTAAATGSPTPTVQWQMSDLSGSPYAWSNIAGATSPSLTVTASFATRGYRAIFTNSAGSATTNAALVVVESGD